MAKHNPPERQQKTWTSSSANNAKRSPAVEVSRKIDAQKPPRTNHNQK